MPKLLWMSDIHLNFLSEPEIVGFLASAADEAHDGILVGGDIAECHSYAAILRMLAEQTPQPIWFVLGNHDAYHGSLAGAREQAVRLDAEVENLHWLPGMGVVALDEDTVLVGHGSWGDGRNGDALRTGIILNDWIVIEELAGLPDGLLLERLAELGDEAADHFTRWLPQALADAHHVVVLTHVPPFANVNMRGDEPMRPEYLPFYTCRVVGEILRQAMEAHPDRRMTVLSGHTHGGGRYDVLPNLTAWTLPTSYGAPTCVRAPLAPDDELDPPGL